MSTTHKPTLVTFRVFLIQCTLAGLYRVQRIQISNIRLQTSPTLLGQKTSVGNWNIMPWTFTSHGMLLHTIFRAYLQCQTDPTLFVGAYNIMPQQCLTTHFSCETTISGPNNVRPHTYRARLQCQAPKSHTFRARLQYQAPTMSDPTLFVWDNNIRLQQCQTPCFSCENTISGPDNVRPQAFRARLQ